MSILHCSLRSFGSEIMGFLVLILTVGVCCPTLSATECGDTAVVPRFASSQGFQVLRGSGLRNRCRQDVSATGRSVAFPPSGSVSHRQPAKVQPPAVVNDNWNGGIGNWSVGTNWSAGVPNNGGGNTYNVTIDSSGADVVTLDVNSTISTLTLGGSSVSSLLQNKSGVAETLNITGALMVNVSGVIIFGDGSTLTVGAGATNAGLLQFQTGSTVTVTGNLSNSGELDLSPNTEGGAANNLTVNGTLTNTGIFRVGASNLTADVANVKTLVNSGTTYIGTLATLNLTNQPNGITDVVAGSELDVAGSLKAGAANGLAHLSSIEGTLRLENGKSTAATPGGGTLTVSSSGLLDVENSKTALTVAGNLTNAAPVDVGSGSALTVVGNLTNSAQVTNLGTLFVKGTFTNNGGDTLTVGAGSVANIGTLVNDGLTSIASGGTLTLTNSITDVAAGSELDVAGTLKNGLTNLGSVEGTLRLENGKQSITATPGGGTLIVSSSGLLDLTNGLLIVSGNLTNSGLIMATATLNVTGTFTNNAGARFFVEGVSNVGTLVNDGLISIGYGGDKLNLTNQPNGITDVVAGSELDIFGALTAGTANGLANLGSVEGTLRVENGRPTTATPGGGTLTVSSSGILDAELATTLTVAGNLTNSGQVYVNAFQGRGSIFTVNGIFTNNAGALFRVAATGTANVDILVNHGTVTINPTGTLNLLTQPSGITDVAAGSVLNVMGSLTAGSNNGLAKLTSVEGTLNLSNGKTTTATPSGGTLTVSGPGLLEVGSATSLTIAGNLTNSGRVTFDATTTVTGALTNNAGATFALSGSSNVGLLSNAGNVIVTKGSTLTVTGSSAYNQTGGKTTVDGTLSGSHGINVTGGTILGAGKLTGNVTVGGTGTTPTINVGDSGKAGLLAITGTYTQLATGTMKVSIGGTTLGTQFSQLQVSGAASLGGTLSAALVNGFTPTVGQTFTVLTASGVTGTFTNSTIAINGSEHFVVSYTSTSVVLTVASGPASKTSRTASVSQKALAITKQPITVAKPLIRIAGLRHEISGSKLARPVWGTGLLSVPRWREAHSGLIMGDTESIGVAHVAPVISAWERVPVQSQSNLRIMRNATPEYFPTSNNWVGRSDMRMRPVALRTSTIRPAVPVRMLPTHLMVRSVQ
jgi:hypothetical protein